MPNKFSKVPMTAAMETVRPAAINPDSTAVVLFTKRTMGLLMFLAPLPCSVQKKDANLKIVTVVIVGYVELGDPTRLFAGLVSWI
jgi:hypothetical protein